MSRQLSMDNFFKVKSSMPSPHASKLSEHVGKKRRSLSLIKPVTPIKTPKKVEANTDSLVILDLCSDEENENESFQLNDDALDSDLSQRTVLYDLTPKTPQKTPQSASSFQSSGSADKFYSPSKKRVIKKRTPVKRSLVLDFFQTSPAACNILTHIVEDEVFEKACQGMDDKTIFLLTIISKCMQDESLKNLLDVESQQVLSQCMLIVQPGMRLVCRLFWLQHTWYRLDKLKLIASKKLSSDMTQEYEATTQQTPASAAKKTSKKNTVNGRQNLLDDPICHLMIESLLQGGLIIETKPVGDNNLTFDEYISLLRSDELKSLCKQLMIKMTSKMHAKEALLELSRTKTISAFLSGGGSSKNSMRVLQLLKQKTGTCYKLSDLARSSLHKLYILMYLGIDYSIIRDKKLELMLLYDKIKREIYPIDKDMEVDSASVVFTNSQDFLRYVAAHNIYEEFIAHTDWKKKCVVVLDVFKLYTNIEDKELIRYKALPPWLRKFTPVNLYVKILESGIVELKRHRTEEYYTQAVAILTALISQDAFRQHKRAEWYAEKALILHKLMHREEEAAKVLLEGFKSSMRSSEKDLLRPRALRLSQMAGLRPVARARLARYALEGGALERTLPGIHLYRKPMDNDSRGKIKFQTRTENLFAIETAEQCCITHFLATGEFTHGEHWEGKIVTTLFFLLFWDIIYSKPPGLAGVFLTHYQKYPLDLFTESFYTNRKKLIDERLTQIQNSTTDELMARLTHSWEERSESGLSVVDVSIGLSAVCGVARALSGPAVAALCRRLATDYNYSRSGFPDLTLWNDITDKVMFVEVKTDADKPSMKQIQWMHYLKENCIDTSFCYVGVNTTRCKARAMGRDYLSDSD